MLKVVARSHRNVSLQESVEGRVLKFVVSRNVFEEARETIILE